MVAALGVAPWIQAGDWLALAGRPGATLADGRIEWLQATDGSLAAWVWDPARRVSEGDGDRIVVGEPLPSGDLGFPVLEVREVLPAAWAEPAVWSRRERGPSAFAGLRWSGAMGRFAGIPASDRRAGVQEGGGWLSFQPEVVKPEELGRVSLTPVREGWMLQSTAPVGREVALLRSEFLAGPYTLAGVASAGPEGVVQFLALMRGEAAFFRMELR